MILLFWNEDLNIWNVKNIFKNQKIFFKNLIFFFLFGVSYFFFLSLGKICSNMVKTNFFTLHLLSIQSSFSILKWLKEFFFFAKIDGLTSCFLDKNIPMCNSDWNCGNHYGNIWKHAKVMHLKQLNEWKMMNFLRDINS